MKVYNYTGFFIVLSGVNLKGEKIERGFLLCCQV